MRVSAFFFYLFPVLDIASAFRRSDNISNNSVRPFINIECLSDGQGPVHVDRLKWHRLEVGLSQMSAVATVLDGDDLRLHTVLSPAAPKVVLLRTG
jgi:hypothetical protein